MKLEDIQLSWKQDSQIDRTELGEESLRIPQLHSKYFNLYSQERLTLKKTQAEYKQLYKRKFELYAGTISEEELNEWGWEPFSLKILKADMGVYLEADEDLNKADLKIEMQKEKIYFLDSIIKSLPNRGFQIKNAIEWTKFQMGG
jgi:hypothetical protein